MKLLFINPPSIACFDTWYPPLGIAYISSYLKQKTTWKTCCCDAAIGESPLAKIKAEKPDLIGITCSTIGYMSSVKIAEKIKERYPDIPVILGGQHISALPQILPKAFDACVVGEGENAVVAMANELEQTGKLSKRVYSAPRVENLDDLPFPDREMFNLAYYLQPTAHNTNFYGVGVSMFTSRGCLYRCVFCSSARFFDPPIRGHSATYVADEMEMLKDRYKVKYLNVFDDLFQYSKERLKALAAEVESRGLDQTLIIQAHAPTFDEETASLLKRIGVGYCGFGLEASTPSILKWLKCGVATVEDNRRAVRLAHKHGMYAGSGFMVGVPGQTEEDLDANDAFIREEKLDSFRKYILCPYPGTPLWDYAKERGLVSEDMDFTRIYQTENGRNVILSRGET